MKKAPPRPSADDAVRTTPSEPIDMPTTSMSQATRTASGCSDAGSTHSRTPSSTLSASSGRSASARTWIKSSPTINVHTTCGRHTDQYFFGGPSLAELARSVMKKKA